MGALWSLINNQLWATNSEHQPILKNQLWTLLTRVWVRRSRKDRGRNGRQSWGLLLEEYSSDDIRGLIFWLEDSCSKDDFRKKKCPDRKTEEEILTLRQVLTAKERHAAGKIDYWPHTPKILHQNDKHTISVERFAKLKNFQVWSADWASPSGGSSARTWPRAWKICRRAPHTREQRKIFNLQRFWENTTFQAFQFKSLVDCTTLQDIAREKSAGLIAGISASSTFQVLWLAIVCC